MFLIILFLIKQSQSEWRLIFSDFYQESLNAPNSIDYKKSCTDNQDESVSIKNCGTNPLDYLRLKDDRTRMELALYYPHYQLRIITDVIYIRAKPGSDSEFKIYVKNSSTSTQLYSRQYQESDISSYSNVCSYNCNSGCGSLDNTKIEIKTMIFDSINDKKDRFNISYCYTYQDSDMKIGLRNIFVYAQTCHFTCLTCQGGGQSDCLTCYNGALQGGLCVCNDEANSYIQLLTGCVQECNRNYYLADSQKYCQFDSRIQSKVDYFTSSTISNGNLIPYSPWIFTQDPFYPSNVNKIYTCNGNDIVGKLQNYEFMTLQLAENLSLKFLRIRVSFYLFNWQVGSKLRISVDNYEQSIIIKTATNYTFDSLSLVKFSSSSCSGNYDLLRIETILNTQTTTPIIMFQGYTSLQTEYWGFRNITIDYGLCTSNCTECETYSRCKICDTNYQLYRGTCVKQCPSYTSILSNGTCEDYEDQIKNSRYLIKAFYDTNTTFEEVKNVVDNFTTSGDALQQSFTGSYYSFVPEKSVLGGVLVWKSGKFKKTFTSLNPHYKISYRLNVTYGDENPGWFKYIIGSDTSIQINNPNNGNYNSVGFSKNEATKYLEGLQRSHSNTQLDIILQADTMTSSLADAFIYVSEYFLVVHYCAPFCLSCNGPEISDCNAGQYSGYSSTSYCQSNQYLNFDSITSVYTCINCPQLGCLECKSQSVCTLCEYSTSNQFYLDSGTCKCYPSAYLSNPNCLQCNIYCETCFGQNYNECYTCLNEFHRSIYQNQCKCVSGYYDDDVNLQCLPICGDLLVVDGEDCDDGNDNPFDGCDQCQFSCQDSCLDCQNGKCYECKDYFVLIPSIYYCMTNCGDNVVIDNEECDDGNIYPYDGCYLCKYQCYQNCIDCTKGVCNKCDEINGYYLTGSGCEPICGDGIIAKNIEECDDLNFDPFDLCDACEFGCDEFCEICSLGHCSKCLDGFKYISKIQKCIPICRDYKTVGYEECDDNNFAIYDGCYDCKFQCQSQCTDCQFGKCYECNYPGWQINLQTYLCETIMNDLIVSQNEQCDDGNIQPMDGCFEQYYECQDSCSACYFGQCIRCLDQWYLNKQDHICYPLCGDGKVVGNEFCDDKNTKVYDSCYQCNFICDKNCNECFYGDCLNCMDGFQLSQNKCIPICGDGLLVDQEFCDDDITKLDKQNCQQCRYICDGGCQVCTQGICEKCKNGYMLQDFNCIPICGDNLVNGIEECDDGNDIPFDGCNECKFECQQECLDCKFNKCYDCEQGYLTYNDQCQDNCGNEVVTKNEDCDDGNLEAFDGCFECKYSCDSQCAICQYGRCYQCKKLGLVINDVDNTCQPYCGDQIVVGNEQCDDGNDIRFDGCYECFFECQNECTMCIDGECHQCNTIGWELVQHSCAPICGDLLVVGTEDCDDGNTLPYDGCYDCQYQCQDECTSCVEGICKECNTLGWILISNFCQPDCGDSIVIDQYEQCDDGNDEQYDGCYQCSYQCQSICDDCIDGKCYSCSELGWVVENYFCVPYCGDGLIVGNEQCDNGNAETDYCQNCKLICDKYCTDCQNGQCNDCELGRYLDNNQCETLCGDGILIQEDCDDGNLDNGDGCSEKCKVEYDWACTNTYLSQSSCFYSKSPLMKLELLTKYPENIENVRIYFDQPMMLKYDENFTANYYFNGSIANLLSNQYLVDFNFTTIPLFSSAINIEVIATITFYENIEDPIFIVVLNDTAIVNEFQTQVIDNEQQLKLKTPMVLSSGLKSSSESAKSFTNTVIYFMIALSGICIITGSFEMFWNLMDLLQYLSYIKYVNIPFPSNLNIYFEVFNLITIQPLMDATGISVLFNSLDGDQNYIVQTSDKFQADQINGYFYTNFQSSIFCLIGIYGGYFIAKFGSQVLYQIGPYFVSQYGFYAGKVIYVIRNLLKQSQQEFHYNGILRVIMSNYYDISFSVFIQLINFDTSNTVYAVNSYAAIFVCFAQISFFSYMLVKLIAFTKTTTVKKRQQYVAIFEGVQESNDVWVSQYNSILLLKKQIFIFFIVFMESDGALQTICIAVNQTFFLIYIIHLKPITNIYEYYKTIVAESLLSFNTLLFLAYAYKVELQLDVQNQYLIGWVHIAGFSFILIFSLLCDITQQTQNIYRKIVKLLSSKKQTEHEGTIIFY